jgi:hypothetical protein
MGRLCYDTQHVEAMPFPVDIPDKTPYAFVRLFSGKTSVETSSRVVYAEHFLSLGMSPEKKSG